MSMKESFDKVKNRTFLNNLIVNVKIIVVKYNKHIL